MDFGVRLAGAFGMSPRVQPMAVRDMGVMGRLLMRTDARYRDLRYLGAATVRVW